MSTGWEQARTQRALAYFDELSQSFDPLIGNYNSNYPDDIDRIHRLDPRPILSEGEFRADGRVRLFQRKSCFLKVVLEGPGSLMIGWGYWIEGTGDVVFPEINHLLLDSDNDWQLYRYRSDGGKQEHVEQADTLPYHLAKTLIERLAQVSAVPPELATSLAL